VCVRPTLIDGVLGAFHSVSFSFPHAFPISVNALLLKTVALKYAHEQTE
jgi:hypothetical protein